jgi:hypothetical protein
MPDADDARLKLTPAQQRIYAALIRYRADLGEWYRAAIAVINDHELPDRLSLAAHSLREVMEKLPGESQDRGADLPSKVRELQPPWIRARQEQERAGGAWNGSEPLREFLDAMQLFFDGQAQLVNSRRDYGYSSPNHSLALARATDVCLDAIGNTKTPRNSSSPKRPTIILPALPVFRHTLQPFATARFVMHEASMSIQYP